MSEGLQAFADIAAWKAKLREALGTPSQTFAEAKEKLSDASHGFHLAMAAELEPIVNDRLRRLIDATFETKKQTVDEIRELLKSLNLAVVCPNTKEPGMIYAVAPSYRNKHIQYWIRPRNAKTSTYATTDLEKLLPIELAECQQRKEGLGLWHSRVASQNDNPIEL